MTTWSKQAWTAARPIYEAILQEPFVRELVAGTLTSDKFEFYLRQDRLYIDNYCRVLASIASRMGSMDYCNAFLDFAKDGVAVESAMHLEFLKGKDLSGDSMTPTCLLYTSVLNSCLNAPAEVAAAAILPCFWIYFEVGRHIAKTAQPDNPYSAWIATYSDPAFEKSNSRAIAICDTLAEKASEDVRREMTRLFVLCSKMEWLFWDSAYNKEQWKI